MLGGGACHHRRIQCWLGLFAVAVAAGANEWLLCAVFSDDGGLDATTLFLIRSFELAMLIIGLSALAISIADKPVRALRWVGLLVAAGALSFNEWTVAATCFGGAELSLAFRLRLWGVTLGGCLSGLMLTGYGLIGQTHPAAAARFLLTRRPKTSGVLIGGLLTCAAVLVSEAVFFGFSGINRPHVSYAGDYTRGLFEPDDLLGYKPQSQAEVDSIASLDGRPVYAVRYATDRFGRRRTSAQHTGSRPASILFFGGSYTFGEGVNDDETLVAQFAELSAAATCYNYGFCGYGPQATLAILSSDRLTTELPRPPEVAIYTFIDDHVRRAIGSMRVATTWGGRMPHYTIGPDGRPHKMGDLTSGRPFRSLLYSVLAKSHTLSFLEVDVPPVMTERHIAFTAKLLAESARLFRERLGGEEFVVLLYPGVKLGARLAEHLRASGVRCLDYSTLFDPGERIYHIDGDGHPTPAAYGRVAKRLANDMHTILSRVPDARIADRFRADSP